MAGRRDENGLTPKQQAFVLAYLETGNSSEAYRRAYPTAGKWKPAAVREEAERTLSLPHVSLIVEAERKKSMQIAMDKYEVTHERLIAEWASIAFHDASDYFEWGPDGVTVKPSSELTKRQLAAVSSVSQTVTEKGGTIKVSLSDKQAALKSLGQIFGMFVERKHITMDGSIKDMSTEELHKFIEEIDDIHADNEPEKGSDNSKG
jgi:phage terminase small subunit